MCRRLWAALFITLCYPSYAQFLPDLQAKTVAEYDAYLAVQEGPVRSKGEAFAKQYPESSLRLPVYEWLAAEYRKAGEREKAIAATELGLGIAPDYIPLLVEQADLLANGAGQLAVAAESARRALEFLQTAKAPQRISPEEWKAATDLLRARAHNALGLILFKRDDMQGAIESFKAVVALHTAEDAAAHYRLGRIYALLGKRVEARQHLQAAYQAGSGQLREMARAALASL